VIFRVQDPLVLDTRLQKPDMDGLVLDFDAEAWLSDPANLALSDGRNMMLFSQESDDTYCGHWLLVDRGRDAFLAAIELLRSVFTDYRARTVYGLVPAHCRASAWFTRQMGFVSSGMEETDMGAQEKFSMTRREFEARYGLSEVEEQADQPTV
jgi:hypothetical protein